MEKKSVDTKSDDKTENKDSKKKEIKKIGAFPYKRQDLVWEAVRRNEDYKEFYKKAKKKYPNGKNENKNFSKYYKGKWLISMQYALSPDITAKELRKKIIDGANPAKVHPYYFMFSTMCKHCRIVPEDWQNWSIKEADDDMYLVDEDSVDILNDIIDYSKQYVPIWIAPWADEEEIKEEVTKILRPLKEIYQQEYDKMVKRKLIVSCNPKSIDQSIKILERYDEIIDKFKTPAMIEQYGELEKKDGYYIIPELKQKIDIIPDRTYDSICHSDSLINTNRNKYWTSYNNAILLIKNAPNIIFRPSRNEAPKKSIKGNYQIKGNGNYQIPISSCDIKKPLIIIK